jgi:hypothetical protein
MAWPQTVDYNSAIQNPSACFADAELARGQPAEGMLPGIPLSYAGNFATVYKMVCPSGAAWAVKCFTRKVDNLQQRYREISEHLNRRKRRFVVDFQYLAEGIRVEGAWYPVLKMQWVQGFTLNEFLRDRAGNAALLEQLCQLWLRLGNDMREDRMAHGDLQHGNVLLVPGSSATSMLLRLVDYDGMWVPSLADLPPGEVGHANYQHPQRLATGGYDDQIDRFAHLEIYVALRCLMIDGEALWSAHDNGENLLCRESDFKLPANSRLFPKLLALPDAATATLAGHLLLASQGPLDRVPLVGDLLAGAAVAPLSAEQIDRIRALVPPASSAVLLTAASATLAEVKLAASEGTVVELPILSMQPTAAVRRVSAEQRSMAAQLFAHVQDVLEKGDLSYAQEQLYSCCKLDPGTIEYRRLLRELSWELSGGKGGGWLTSLSKMRLRRRLRKARTTKDHRKVLECGEELLSRSPGDVPTQLDMVNAAESLGLHTLADWLLRQAREHVPAKESLLCAQLEERQNRLLRSIPAHVQTVQAPLPDWAVPAGTSLPPNQSAGPEPLPVSPAPYIWLDRPRDRAIVSDEQRRMADEVFARAGEVLYKGDPIYALELLLSCCKLDPGCIAHRQRLREVGRQVRTSGRGCRLEALSGRAARGRLRAARNAGDHRKVLEQGEELLARYPDDARAQIAMADAAEALGLPTLAIWLLEEAHDRVPGDLTVLRVLAQLCERHHNLEAAVVVWQRIHRARPADAEAIARIAALSSDGGARG